uniref:Cytochrome P450 n=1 Tax=Globodera rostochiensis TaxID=31243 RepID=A0A914HZN6_GLORO
MGQSVNAQLESNSDYHNPLMWLDTIFNWFGDGKEHSWALKVLHSFTRNVIGERREMRAREGMGTSGNGDERLAFLDLLLEMEQHGELKEQDIQNEVDTFMFEGHDTTSSAVVWALFMLGNHQSIQQRVFDEIQSVCGFDPLEERPIRRALS